jgi:hypothetical protein
MLNFRHQQLGRREAIQIGASSILGLGINHWSAIRAANAQDPASFPAPNPTSSSNDAPLGVKAKSCIFIFLSGGLAQHESFDLKPNAPAEIRGEFLPIATKTPGLQICEHLPRLASISNLWSLCRSLGHPSNDHSVSHHVMLTGQSNLPPGFNPNSPNRTDFPSLASKIAYARTKLPQHPANNLPPAIVLPERLVHNTGRVLPGQHAGMMGQSLDPWFLEASSFHATSYGAFPLYGFDHQDRGKPDERVFQAPQLSIPHTQRIEDLHARLALLNRINQQRKSLDQLAETQPLDRFRESAANLMVDPKVHRALDVTKAHPDKLARYGLHSFGWSLLMARQLVDVGVPLIQVNLGNNETWDTHGNAFPHLKNNLLPPMDQAVSALLEDLHASGQLSETLVVMAGEFGRTPKITHLAEHYKLPGRDHWGACQSVLFAGGGIQPGVVVGKTDAKGAYPIDSPTTPENFAATIFHLMGIPANSHWQDSLNRPFALYQGEPISGLM